MTDARAWGIDPGAEAGACALVRYTPQDPGRVQPGDVTVESVLAWRRRTHGYELADGTGAEWRVGTLYAVALSAAVVSARVSCEALFVGHGNPASALALAEACGVLLGPFTVFDPLPLRPHPSTWRGRILGLGRPTAKQAAARAIEVVEHLAPGELGPLATNDHAADAVCLGLYGAIVAMGER